MREAIHLQAALFHKKADTAELLRAFNLEEKAGAYCSRLSGGQKQRLFILLAVIHDPDILFFDELSTGLDPVSRQEVWNYVDKLKKQGKTILVSTHYMQEAEKICDLYRCGIAFHRSLPYLNSRASCSQTAPAFSCLLPLQIQQHR